MMNVINDRRIDRKLFPSGRTEDRNRSYHSSIQKKLGRKLQNNKKGTVCVQKLPPAQVQV